jgi:hypothetical protein
MSIVGTDGRFFASFASTLMPDRVANALCESAAATRYLMDTVSFPVRLLLQAAVGTCNIHQEGRVFEAIYLAR